MSGFFTSPALTTTLEQALASGSSAGLFNSAGTGAFAGVTSGTVKAARAASTAANLEAFTKGLGALGGLATAGTAIASAVKGTKKPEDPYKRQRELERRLIAQRAGQREGGIRSTNLTGPLGDLEPAPTGKRTLLGG